MEQMVYIVSVVFTCLALLIIPVIIITRRLSVHLSFKNILRFIKLVASQLDDEEENNEKSGTIGEEDKRRRLPKHVAIILDGNRRWAEKRGLGTSEGHHAGARRLIENAKDCFAMGINTVSLFAFSTENWARPEDEVNGLMALFEKHLRSEMAFFRSDKIKISVIGNRTKISQSLLGLITEAEEATKNYEEKHLIIAIDYSGRFDILQACKSLAEKAKNGLIQVEDIDEDVMEKELMTNCSEFPNPDLLIRTSGEQRISNFFLWQSAYTELYFPNVLWPDFGEAEYLEALTCDEGTYVAGEEETPKGLLREQMPRHVAVIMDGNRRWAERAGLLTSQGHEAGAKRLIEFAELCFKLGIETVSAFAFSTENWGRHKIEVNCLMSLFQRYLKSKIQFFQSEEIRVSVIGNLEKIPESLLGTIKETEEATKRYKKKHLILAIDYSGRFDILHACKSIVKKSQQGLIREEDVDQTLFERELLTKCTEFPSPDLLIRTSGEQRISNFLLWQLAYTELFFSPVLWPDFDKDRVIEALVSYQRRERRFGCRI
ncbi:unnamed protein product [Brassica napus]|uniref:(rape) hypothetical protein n=1 Tax=Brassica napus TaxID=3708 RepID=A0A816WQ71_BRANA|nr:unnamed protein product [Brassica napus]